MNKIKIDSKEIENQIKEIIENTEYEFLENGNSQLWFFFDFDSQKVWGSEHRSSESVHPDYIDRYIGCVNSWAFSDDAWDNEKNDFDEDACDAAIDAEKEFQKDEEIPNMVMEFLDETDL